MPNTHYHPITTTPAQNPVSTTNATWCLTRANFADEVFFGALASTNGTNLRFYTDVGLTSELAFGVREWTQDTSFGAGDGSCVVFVSGASLTISHLVDTTIYVAFGDNSLPAYAPGSTYGLYNAFDVHTAFAADFNDPPVGGVLTDISGNGNNGTLVNGATQVAGKLGGAWQFNGTTQYVDCGDITGEGVLGLSLTAIVNHDTVAAQQRYISQYGSTNFVNRAYLLTLSDSGAVTSVFAGDGVVREFAQGTTVLSAATTYHVAGVWDLSTIRTIVNGASEASTAYSATELENVTNTVKLGRESASSSAYLDGSLSFASIATTGRTTGWTTRDYNNQNSPGTYATAGAVVAIGGGTFKPHWALNRSRILGGGLR